MSTVDAAAGHSKTPATPRECRCRAAAQDLAKTAASALVGLVVSACGNDLPGPPTYPNQTAAYAEVPFPPPAARIEAVPARPDGKALWVDGEWRYRGRRWRWIPGAWFEVPPGVKYAHWASTIRADGVFLYAPGEWVDGNGKNVSPPRIVARGSSEALAIDEDPGMKDEAVVHGPDVPPNLKAGIGSGSGVAPASSASQSEPTSGSGAH